MRPSAEKLSPQLQKATQEFDTQGFTVIKGFLNPEETKSLLNEVERYAAEVAPKLPKEEVFYADKQDPKTIFRLCRMNQHDPFFTGLSASDRYRQVAEILLDDDVKVENTSLFGKAPVIGEETPAHQDGNYFMLEPNHALTMWLALDPANLTNGCIRYVPGSHKRGMRPHGRSAVFGFSLGLMDFGQEDIDQEVAIEAEPGDLIVHHSLTIHRADPNPSEFRRWAIGMCYYARSAMQDESKRAEHQKRVNAQMAETGKI